MFPRRIALLALAASFASPVAAQELGGFGVAGSREFARIGDDYGIGMSIAGFISTSRVFGADAQRLADSEALIGLRASLSYLTVGEEAGHAVFAPCPPPGCTTATSRRITAQQIVLLVRPHRSSESRVDVGAGVNFYSVRDLGSEWGFVATAGWLRRLGGPVWLSLSYDLHGQIFETDVADGPNFDYSRHMLRAGLSLDLRRSN